MAQPHFWVMKRAGSVNHSRALGAQVPEAESNTQTNNNKKAADAQQGQAQEAARRTNLQCHSRVVFIVEEGRKVTETLAQTLLHIVHIGIVLVHIRPNG
jgi:hypothetical protein